MICNVGGAVRELAEVRQATTKPFHEDVYPAIINPSLTLLVIDSLPSHGFGISGDFQERLMTIGRVTLVAAVGEASVSLPSLPSPISAPLENDIFARYTLHN